jgi:DNA polymerase IIIc chi subunit
MSGGVKKLAQVAVGAVLGFAQGGPWGAVAGAALAFYAAEQQEKLNTKSPLRDNEPSAQTVRSSKAPVRFILGRVSTGGVLVWAQEQSGAQGEGEWLHLVYVLCEGAIDALENIYLGEEEIGSFGPLASYELIVNPTQVNAFLKANCPDWKDSQIGRGLSFVRVSLQYSAEKFPSGIPDTRFVVRGRNDIYDPRTGTAVYSANTALHLLWFLRARCGVPDDEIVFETFASAANVCDEALTNADGSTSQRYRTACVIGADEQRTGVLQKLEAACAGKLIRVGGRWMLQAGAYYGPYDFEITEDMVVGTITGSTEPSNDSAINTVRGTFIDPSQSWTETDYPEVQVDQWVVEDGGEAAETLTYSYVTDPYQAQRLANIELRRRRAGGAISIPMNFAGYNCRPGRVVRVNLPSLNILGEFIVSDWSMGDSEGCTVQVKQYEAPIFDDAVGQPYNPIGFINLPAGGLGSPTNLKWTQDASAEVTQGILSWLPPSGIVKEYIVIVRQGATAIQSHNVPATSTERAINGLPSGSYTMSVAAVGPMARSGEATISVSVNGPPIPEACVVQSSIDSITLIPSNTLRGLNGGTYEYFFSTVPSSDPDDAVYLGQGLTFTHTGLGFFTNYYYFVRSSNAYGKSAFLYVPASTSNDVGAYLDALDGQLNETQLGQGLLSRIELIDGPPTLPGSVSNRVNELGEQIGEVTDHLQELVNDGQAALAEAQQAFNEAQQAFSEAQAELQQQIDQVSTLAKSGEYQKDKAYAVGASTRLNDRLYQAKIAVPADASGAKSPPNATYWVDVGQVVSDSNGLAARVNITETKITSIEGVNTSQGTAITGLNNSLTTTNTNVTAAQNAANAANSLAGGKGKVLVQAAAPAAADQLVQNLWIDITGGANTPKRWTGSAWAAVTDKVATDAAAAAANALSVANTKADASAVNSLTTRVEAAEGTISSQGSSITGLTNSLTTTNTNVTAAQNAANAANTLAGGKGKVLVQAAAPAAADQLAQNLWIDITGGTNTPKRWTGSAWAAVTDKVATDAAAAAANALLVVNTKADASAVNSLTTRVTAAEGTISSQGSSITGLNNSLTTTNTNVTAAQNAANAANTLAGGKGKVLVQTATPATADQLAQNLWIDITGGANTPKRWTGSAWAAVTDKVATDAAAAAANALSVANTKADASAVNSLTTRVEAAEGTISSQGSSITGLNNSLTTTNTNVTAAQNAANAANTLAGGKGKVLVQAAAPSAADQLAQNLWIDITGGANTPKRWNGSAWAAVTDKVATDAAAAAANALSVANTKADASAVNSLTTRVTAAEGVITSQGSSITSLNNSIGDIGSQNLLYNPAFTKAGSVAGLADGWDKNEPTTIGASTGVYSLVPSWINAGENAQRIDVTGINESNLYRSILPSTAMRPAAQGGTSVALSVYFRATAGLQVRLYLQAVDAVGAVLAGPSTGFSVATGGTQRAPLLFANLPAGTVKVLPFLRVFGSSGVTAGFVEFTRAQIEIGAVVSGWRDSALTLASEQAATSAALSTLTSTVTQQGTTLTSQGASLTSLNNSLTTTNTNVTAAQNAANAANALAGGKGKVLVQAAAPAAADQLAQNLWIDITGGANTPKRWTGSTWAAVTDKVATDAAAAAANALSVANTKADGSAVTSLASRVTAAEGTISSQGSSITSLTNNLSTTGGQNLLYNPSFERVGPAAGLAEGWRLGIASGVTATPALVPSGVDPQGLAQRIALTGLSSSGTTGYCDLGITGNVTGGFNAKILPSVAPGQAVTMSAWVKATAGLVIDLYFQFKNAAQATILTNGPTSTIATGAWQRVVRVCSAAAPADTVATDLLFRIKGASAALVSGDVEWDQAQLEVGSVATGWKDSVFVLASDQTATSDALSTLTSTVTQQGTTLTSQGASLTSLNNSLTTTNTNVTAAQNAANAANTLAGGKGKVLVQAAAPAAADQLAQNLWIDITGGTNTPKRWTGSAWAAVTDKVATDAAAAAANALLVVNTKADASAVNSLTTRVTAAEGTISSQGSSITGLNNSLTTTNTNVTAAQNAANAANTLAGGKGKVLVQTAAPAAADQLAQNLWIDITGGANTPKRWTGSAWAAVTDKVATDAAAAAANALSVANTKADASAVTGLTSRVTAAEGTISSQGDSITSLTNTISRVGQNSPTRVYQSLFSALASDQWRLNSASLATMSFSNVAGNLSGATLTFDCGTGKHWWGATNKLIRFDPSRLYKVSARVQQVSTVAGNTQTYLGLDGYAEDGVTRISTLGTSVTSNAHYVLASSRVLEVGVWTEFSTYVKGFTVGAENGGAGAGTLADPRRMKTGIAWISPMGIFGYNNLGGVAALDYFWIEDVTEQVQIEATSSALSSLTSTVTQQGTTMTSQGSSITSLSNSLTTTNTNVTAAQNAANAANTLAGGKGKVLVQTTAPAAADQLAQNLWIDITGGANTPKRWTGSAWVAVTDKVAADAAAAAASALSVANTKADASAVSSLTTRVTSTEEQITAQANKLDGIYVQVNPVLAGDASGYSGSTASFVGVWSEQSARIEDGIAIGREVDTVQAAVDANNATVQQVSQAQAGLNGKVSAMWSVKLQVNAQGQYVAAGVGLGIENGPAGLQSTFLVSADRFAVVNDINGTLSSPFAVTGGQVFIRSAFIQDLSLSFGKIADNIQSDNYVANSTGWKLSKAGGMELNSTVAGQGRVQVTNRAVKVWDANGVLRVQLGDLSA